MGTVGFRAKHVSFGSCHPSHINGAPGAAAMRMQGRQYKDMLYVIDLSSDIVPQQLTNSSFTGGYGIVSTASS